MDFLGLLAPSDREPDAPDCPYAPLIGSWRINSRWYAPDAPTRTGEGEWHFSWIFGGWGVQDILFASDAPAGQRGTSIRCFDAAADAWRVVWMMPSGGEFVSLLSREDDGDIVQEGDSLDGSSRQRWTFSEITNTGFVWRGESSLDDGLRWTLDQEMRATRSG